MAGTRFREATLLRIHVPVAPETLAAMLAGDGEASERDPVLARFLAIVREDNPLGDFGHYQGVAEIGLGWESFRPEGGAMPTLGKAGETSLSPTVILGVHAPCPHDDPRLLAVLEGLLAAQPWEVPVIEVTPVRLVTR